VTGRRRSPTLEAGLGAVRPGIVYVLITVAGVAAFLYPFWLPRPAVPGEAHATAAPLLAAVLVGLLVVAVALEVRHRGMNGATVALLGVLSASAGLLRLLDLPGGGSGIFFLVILAGAAFGPRFGLLLGMSAMALSAVITGGLGPWLPFQMLGLGWMGASAGLVGRLTSRRPGWSEVIALAALGWAWGYLYGAILNLWAWPFFLSEGELYWHPGLSLAETLHRYHAYYVTTSLAWDAAGATVNAVLILLTGAPLLASMRRFSHRLAPTVDFGDPGEDSAEEEPCPEHAESPPP
jgi:energy-coupling factor transport system substrate-specific component